MFSQDTDGGRRFYFCSCGNLQTVLVGLNGASEGWPQEIIEQAIDQGLMEKMGDAQVRVTNVT